MFDEDMSFGVKFVLGILYCMLLLAIIALPTALYDDIYIEPIAANKANEHCKISGFDQYKDFSRVGLLSKEPIAIQCEYSEKYTDLGVRSNIE